MRNAWTPPARWVFVLAAVLGLVSSLQMYLLGLDSIAHGSRIGFGALSAIQLASWFVPVLLLPGVVRISRAFRLDGARRLRSLGVHLVAAGVFALIKFSAAMCVGLMVLGADSLKTPVVGWWVYLQGRFLAELDSALMIYAAIVAAAHALGYYDDAQQRKLHAAQLEAYILTARLRTLEMELNPAFLLNALGEISSLAYRDPDSADRLISRLADLLRITFDRTGHPITSVKEEIEFLNKYIDIERIRFRDRFEVAIEVDPDVLDLCVPRMILQPVVENAISRSLCGHLRKGHVNISVSRSDARLLLEVCDDGQDTKDSVGDGRPAGLALSNTRSRLELLYRGSERFQVARAEKGLTVRLYVPVEFMAGTAVESMRATS